VYVVSTDYQRRKRGRIRNRFRRACQVVRLTRSNVSGPLRRKSTAGSVEGSRDGAGPLPAMLPRPKQLTLLAMWIGQTVASTLRPALHRIRTVTLHSVCLCICERPRGDCWGKIFHIAHNVNMKQPLPRVATTPGGHH
jgi:hypothetical protein